MLANRQEAASVSVHERALQLQSTGEMCAEARAVAGFLGSTIRIKSLRIFDVNHSLIYKFKAAAT